MAPNSHKKKHTTRWARLLCMAIVLVFFCAPYAVQAADDNADVQVQAINPVPEFQPDKAVPADSDDAADVKIQAIDPVPVFEPERQSEVPPASGDLPDKGTIDRIAKNEIVINDQLFTLSVPDMALSYHVGDYVHYIKNGEEKIVRLEQAEKIEKSKN